MKLDVGFIGLGVMGSAMAGHILKAGHNLSVYNRTASKAEALKALGAKVVESPGQLAEAAQYIFICAGDGGSVRDLIFGEGSVKNPLINSLKPGAIVVDHSTIAPSEAEEIAKDLKEKQIEFLDAPITGGDIGARNGTLTIMLGGSEKALLEVKPILELYGKKIVLIGPSGFGQRLKAVNQIGAIGGVTIVTELMKFAEAQGLDFEKTLEVLKDGGASSFALSLYGPKIQRNDFNPGFSVKHSRKDLGIVLKEAQEKGLNLPLTALAKKSLDNAFEKGLEESGNHIMFKLLKEE